MKEVPDFNYFFGNWTPLVPYELPKADNLVQEVQDKIQERWDQAKLNVQVLGTGAALEGWFGIVRGWFTPTDWRSLYRARASVIHAWDGRNVNNKKEREIMEKIHQDMFDTSKYHGASNLMTVVTYGNDSVGTISLFRISVVPREPLAGCIQLLGYVDCVPKPILKDLRIDQRIEYVQKDGKIRCIRSGGQEMPSPVRVSTRTINRKGKENVMPWEELGKGWRTALGIAYDSDQDDDGLVATLPHMMTLLHLKGYGLHDLSSTPVQEFDFPLKSVPYSNSPNVEPCESTEPEWEIKRGIEIKSGPERRGHLGRRVKVITLFPEDSAWANEMLLWS